MGRLTEGSVTDEWRQMGNRKKKLLVDKNIGNTKIETEQLNMII